MYRSAVPAGPWRSSDKRRCGHSERRDARVPPDVCLRDCHKRLQTLESQGKDLRRTAQAPSYGDLRELSCGRARVDEKAARRRQRREAHRCDEAIREFPGLVRSARTEQLLGKKSQRVPTSFRQGPPQVPEYPKPIIANEPVSELNPCGQNIPVQAQQLSYKESR